jgi:hypothetical protein
MAWDMRPVALIATALALAAAGCATSKSSPSTAAPEPSPSHGLPLTGAELSALIPTPDGFTVDASTSFNSGNREVKPVPGASQASAVGCAAWWSGKGYLGPGSIGYAVKNYNGPDDIGLTIQVGLYPPGAVAQVFDLSVAVQRRCRHFTYQDVDGQRYVVNAAVGPSAGIGDRSEEIDATETSADGTVFPTQSTFIQVSDAFVTANETGMPGVPVDRTALPLAAIAASLSSAGSDPFRREPLH